LPPLAPEPTSAAALRVVVSDAGPLISLGRLDLLGLLPKLFSQVQVPDQVLRECMQRPENVDARRIAAAVDLGWLTSCGAPVLLEGNLGRGGLAAIAQALSIGAGVLTDDQEARLLAQSLQLAVIGTLGVLVRAKLAGFVSAVSPLIQTLQASGQRFGNGVVAIALAAAGEASH
jgi:uncharacterized protein